MIMVRGSAYLAAAASSSNIKRLAGASALEKLVYVLVWVMCLSNNSLTQLYAKDFPQGFHQHLCGE